MDGKFTCKVRFFSGYYRTDPPSYITYSSVILRDSVRLGFLLETLNDLDICGVDIGETYLNAECREKVLCKSGP